MRKFTKILLLFLLFLQIISCSKEELDDPGGGGGGTNPGTDTTSRLLIVELNTNGTEIPDNPKIAATFTLKSKDTVKFTHKIGIEIRGQSSQGFPKKQYGFELWDASNNGITKAILNYPVESDFILSAPYTDKSLMRDPLIYEISRSIGRYASRTQFVDLKLNNSPEGTYILMEKLKRDINRININHLKPDENTGDDLTGGYILKIDKDYYGPDNSFESKIPPYHSSGQTIKFVIDTPRPTLITQEQRNYIQNYMDEFEQVLLSDNFKDPDNGYQKYIDVDSFVDFFLLNELANNVDGYRLSTWVVKDKNQKLAMGPIWDFNLAWGNADYCYGGETNVWAYRFNERCGGDFWVIPFWWERLMEDPFFRDKIKTRWNSLKNNQFAANTIIDIINRNYTLLKKSGSATENFTRWPVLGTYVWPNRYIGYSYEDEVNYLKTWVNERVVWLDQNINNL